MATQAKGAPRGRKRALSVAPPPDSCVVIYFSQDRAFQRVFQETDIDEMKSVVKEKLGLGPNTAIRLSQLAEGRRLDLEDDADFYAFQRSAQMKSEIEVEFSVITPPPAQLASPSITSTSTNQERGPAAKEAAGDSVLAPDPDASVPTKKKRKKAAKNSQAPTPYVVVYDTVVSHQDKGKATEPNEDVPAASTSAPPKSKAKTAFVLDEPAAILSTTTTNAGVSTKKPKSKAASKPPQPEEESATTVISNQPEVVVPTKPKKNKKAAAASTPSAPVTSPTTAPAAHPATDPTTSTSKETAAPADPEPTQPPSKKRDRKSGVEPTSTTAPEAPTQTIEPEAAPGTVEQPPTKKRRKSKAPVDETDGPVATSLPPPGPSKRRSSVVLNIDKSMTAPLSSVGSVADIVQRWASRTAEAEQRSHASGSSAAPPNGVSSPALPVQELSVHTIDQSVDANGKAKKRKKKAKEQTGDTSVQAPALEKEVEDGNAFAPAINPSTTKAKEKRKDFAFEPPVIEAQSTPAPIRPTFPKPKKSKLSSVAVSHQSEGSSTDDEDILNSVMRTVPDSDAESVEEDDGKSDEEMVETPVVATPATPTRETTPPSPPSASVTPQAAPVPLPPAPVPTNALLQSQRMTQSNVRALLDDLEDEEAGNANKSDSDDEGSSLARSTPSDVVRRRHRKSGQMDAGDSDAGSYVEVVEDSQGEDVEMQEAIVRNDQEKEGEEEEEAEEQEAEEEGEEEEERALMSFSQMLKSSQSPGADIVPGVGGDDDIEDYESDTGVDKRKSPGSAASSPIESPSGSNGQPSNHDEERPELDKSSKSTQPNMTLSQPAQESEPAGSDAEEPEAPPPKRRGRPPLSQAVKEERAAEKARIQAQKAALKEGQGHKHGRASLKSNKSIEVGLEEIENKAPEDEPEEATEGSRTTRKRSLSRVSSSQQKPALSQASVSADIDPPASKPRGRPRLSEAVLAERQAERERVRAEKAIQRLEKKTAKANAKATKGKGANTSAIEEPDSAQDTNGDASPGPASQQVVDKAELRSEASLPVWSVLNDLSSSRRESSQADELDWSGSDGEGRGKGPLAPQRSVKRELLGSPEVTVRKAGVTAKPLFLPSSGIAIKTSSRLLPPSSPLESTPVSNMLSLSQQTPLQRRKSISAATLPRFTDIQRNHSLRRQSRKEQNRLQSSSQPIKFNPPKDPKPNGTSQDVVMVDDSSSSDGNSSGEEGKRKPLSQSQSQKKRRSAFDYFSQQ